MMMMKIKFPVMAGIACLALLPACALGQQDSNKISASGSATTTAPTNKTTSVRESRTGDASEKSKNKQKKNAAKKAPPKEPTENERIFDEMLRSAMSGGE